MTTSLFEQLQALKTPHDSALTESKIRVSILFDAKEAAGKDPRVIYDLGRSGLQELIMLNSNFKQFETILFDEAGFEVERSVENQDVNSNLHMNIKKFLLHLSPYFLLRPVHMCLEWLIYKFQIHKYNQAEMLGLILPYHETNIFVLVLRTIQLNKDFIWLKPIKKHGKPLSKTAILNHCSTNQFFYKFICLKTMESITEFSSNAHLLCTQINFFSSVIVGVFENTQTVYEWQISSLLYILLKGLKSPVEDFTSSVYMVISQLVTYSQLSKKLNTALVKRISQNTHKGLQCSSVLLLNHIFDKQSNTPEWEVDDVLNFIQKDGLWKQFTCMIKDNIDIIPLLSALVNICMKALQKNHNKTKFMYDFFEELLTLIKFNKIVAPKIINILLDVHIDAPDNSKNVSEIQNGEIIELNSDDDNEEMKNGDSSSTHNVIINFKTWYTGYLNKVQIHCSDAFDDELQKFLGEDSRASSKMQNHAVTMALTYHLKFAQFNGDSLYKSLFHSKPNVRLQSLRILLGDLRSYRRQSTNMKFLKDYLAYLLNDDSSRVVAELLKLSTTVLIDIMGANKLFEGLVKNIYKTQFNQEEWGHLTCRIIEHLSSELILQQFDENLVLLAVFPILFPLHVRNYSVEALLTLQSSPLANKILFLKKLEIAKSSFNASSFKFKFLEIISLSDNRLNMSSFLEILNGEITNRLKNGLQVYYMFLLSIASIKKDTTCEQSLDIFRKILTYTRDFKIKHLKPSELREPMLLQNIPLQLYGDFLLSLVSRTGFQDLPDKADCWEDVNINELSYFLSVFEVVMEQTFSHSAGSMEFMEWTKVLKRILTTVFKCNAKKIAFLINFYVYDTYSHVNLKDYQILRMRSFKLLHTLLRQPLGDSGDTALKTSQILKICLALKSPLAAIRNGAVNTLMFIHRLYKGGLPVDMQLFLKQILKQEHEIIMDAEQYPLILYATLKNQKLYSVQEQLLHLLNPYYESGKKLNSNEKDHAIVSQPCFKAQLMEILNHINDEATIKCLLPLATEVLKQSTSNVGNLEILPWPFSRIFELTCKHFVLPTIKEILESNYQPAKLFIESIFRRHGVYLKRNGALKPTICIFLKAVDKQIYESFPTTYQHDFIYLIIETLAQSENDVIFQAVNKLLKKCSINCKPLVRIIENMYKSSPEENFQNPITTSDSIGNHLRFNSKTWKQGVIVLELLEHNKKLENAEMLFEPLFELLTYCLSLEEQVLLEYVKQLVMMVLLNICIGTKHLMTNDNLMQPAYRLDQIVQCLRTSENPQTYYNAFLLLSECASVCPQQVLDNIVEIFTFMGSSLIRNEYTFNVSILNDILASIIPILVRDSSYLVPVIRVFSDIMLDVPDHRRLPVYSKLLLTLDAESCLWMFLCVVFESQMKEDEQLVKQHIQNKNFNRNTESSEDGDVSENLSTRLQIALELIYSFPPSIVLQTCVQLVSYIKQLCKQVAARTEGIESQKKYKIRVTGNPAESSLFNPNAYTEKQVQHYQNLIMQFVSIVVNSPPFLRHMAAIEDSELMQLKPLYQDIIIELLSFVPEVHAAIEKYQTDVNKEKFWQSMLSHLNDVLDNTVNLLSPDMFLAVVQGLLQHNLLSIRKKIVQLFINKLQQSDDFFQDSDVEKFRNILELLNSIVAEISTSETIKRQKNNSTTNELQLLQQTALIAIQLMSTLFATHYMNEFKNILTILINIAKQRTELPRPILATVLLTMIEICCSLKSHCLPHISEIMQQLVAVMDELKVELETKTKSEIFLTDNVCLALVTCIQKLFDSIPAFLSAYMEGIIISLTSISIRLNAKSNDKSHRHAVILKYINTIWLQMSTCVPLRVVVPKCHNAHQELISAKSFNNITELLRLLQYTIDKNKNQELITVEKDLSKFFMEALQFRWYIKANACDVNPKQIELVESKVISVFLSWVLKLSENTFRQFYRRFYDWCIKEVNSKESILTFFMTTRSVANALKSLFILFASEFVEDLTDFLLQCKNESTLDENNAINSQILAAILDMLQNIFINDNKEFVSVQRMQTLIPAIVNQLDNNLVINNSEMQNLLKQCIGQLATIFQSNVMLKQFNHQVLLKTRANTPEVRLLALNCCLEIARKLGNDFISLIPEVVPFISELLEDENPEVEQSTHKAVQEFEAILGESFQKYL